MILGRARNRLVGFTLLTIFTFAKIFWLKYTGLALSPDEAQYWFWSKHLEWGYYSKPPAVALLIHISTFIFGDSEFGIRVFSPILYFLSTIVVYAIGKELYTTRIGMWSAAIFTTMPAVFFSSALLSTDPMFILFWSCSMYLFIRAIKTDLWCYWVLTGLCAGLGMLTKYSMAIFMISVVLFLYSTPDSRRTLFSWSLWGAVIVALIIWLPNIIWNIENNFVSFQHMADLAGADSKEIINLKGLGKFLLEQFIVFGPLALGGYILAIWTLARRIKRVEYRFLLAFSLPFLIIISLIALKDHAHANWAAPAYIAATVLFCAYFIEINKTYVVKLTFIVHLLVGILGLGLISKNQLMHKWSAHNWQIQKQQDNILKAVQESAGKQEASASRVFDVHNEVQAPVADDAKFLNCKANDTICNIIFRSEDLYAALMKRLELGREIGKATNELRAKYSGTLLAADDRKILAWLMFYSQPDTYKWNSRGQVSDHFDLVANLAAMPEARGRDIILLSKDLTLTDLHRYATAVELIGTVPYRKGEVVKIYRLKKFLGY